MEHGIAIPHGKTDAVDELIACIGVSKHGVDFRALDNEPSRIFIMTLSPVNRTGPHIQFLAEVSQLLRSPERRDVILSATSDDELYKAFVA
jgi:PTS system nitrogen regulatory IIA component